MFKESGLPQVGFVRISKESNKRGIVEIRNDQGDWQVHRFEGSLPFSQLSKGGIVAYSTEVAAHSDREDWLGKLLNFLIVEAGSNRFPTHFKDANGVAWKGDKKALPRLVSSGHFRFSENQMYVESTREIEGLSEREKNIKTIDCVNTTNGFPDLRNQNSEQHCWQTIQAVA